MWNFDVETWISIFLQLNTPLFIYVFIFLLIY